MSTRWHLRSIRPSSKTREEADRAGTDDDDVGFDGLVGQASRVASFILQRFCVYKNKLAFLYVKPARAANRLCRSDHAVV
jgi:hypothetical protein